MTEIKPGTVIDERYEVMARIGGGGMGEIFKARELGLGRVVAVKVLHAGQIGDEDSLARFEREGKILSDLSHKSITVLYRFGVWQQSIPYIAMEYLEGVSLRAELDEHGKLKPDRAISVMQKVTEAMSFAHERGIIHRDLTPNNIMLTSQPEPDTVKLIDFGLAKIFEDDGQRAQHLTQTGLLIGSVFYMSPEQCQGKKSDARSDVYSLGCVLYEAVSGQPPLTADNPIGLMHKHVSETPKPLGDVLNRSEIPVGLQAVVSRAMAKDPTQRYQSMSDFGADLNLVAGGRGKEIFASEPEPASKKKMLVPILALALVGVAVCAGTILMKPVRNDGSGDHQVKTSILKRSTPIGLKGQLEQIVRMPASRERLALELKVIERMTPNALDAAQRRTIYMMTATDLMELNENDKAMAYLKIGLKAVSPSENPAHTAHYYRHMASVQRKVGDHAAAVKNLEKAINNWKPAGEHVVLGGAYADLADSLFQLGRYELAGEAARQCLANITPESESQSWFQSVVTLQAVLLAKKQFAEEAALYKEASKTLRRLPVSVTTDYFGLMRVRMYDLGLFTLAAQRMTDCLAQVLQHKDRQTAYIFSAYLMLGDTYEFLGRYDRSSQVYKEALSYLSRQSQEEPVRRKTVLLKLAQAQAVSLKYSESLENYQKVLLLPMDEIERVRVFIALYNMAMLVDYKSELAKRYELDAVNALAGVRDPLKKLALSLELSEVLCLRQEFGKAVSVLSDARQSFSLKVDSVLLARADNQLGHLRLLLKEFDKAESLLSVAIPVLERSTPDQRYVGVFSDLGQCARQLHHEERTDKLVAAVVEEARSSKNPRRLFLALLDSCVYARDSGNKQLSINYCLEATKIIDKSVPPSEHLHAVVNLGTAYCEKGDYESAMKLIKPQYETIVAMFADQRGGDRPRFQVENILAASYRALDQKEEAFEHYKRGLKVAPTIYANLAVADACFALQKYEEAMIYINCAKEMLSHSPDRANTRTILPVKLREAHCLFSTGKTAQSKKIVTELLALEKSINFDDAEGYWVLELASEIALAEGDKKTGRAYLEHEIERLRHYQVEDKKLQRRLDKLKELETG